ncbi:MAG: Uma2 family endonuclease [Phycisphaeraceae bacterium]
MTAIRSHQSPPSPPLRPLEPGEHLTATEFLRRYDANGHRGRAELINGVVYMAPARFVQHGEPQAWLLSWLGNYTALTPGVRVGAPSSTRLDEDNVPEPDAILRIEGGQSALTDEGYLQGAPELVAEVAASTTSFDLHEKLHVYRRHRVREYIVWRMGDDAIDWFVWREGRYTAQPRPGDGIFKSEVFPGLWLDEAAMRAGNLARVIDVVAEGTRSAEHAAIVKQLEQDGKSA